MTWPEGSQNKTMYYQDEATQISVDFLPQIEGLGWSDRALQSVKKTTQNCLFGENGFHDWRWNKDIFGGK